MPVILFCALLLLGTCSTLGAADKKVAIIGDSPKAEQVADLALQLLSAVDGVTVLERGEIGEILKEQELAAAALTVDHFAELSRITHVDVFATVNSASQGDEMTVSSLSVFDARTGFKLQDLRLAGALDENAGAVADAVISSIERLRDPRKLHYVAVLAVRNAGVPSKYKYQLENIAEEVQRRLTASLKVAVLERSRLKLVTRERKLSQTQHMLLSSAHLLDFEFTQGASPDVVDLALYILSPDGKVIAKHQYNDCLNDVSRTVALLLKNIAGLTDKTPTPEIASAEQESARYFAEYGFYRQLRHYAAAKGKLESAIALNPRHIKYLVEYQRAIAEAAGTGRRMTRAERLNDLIEAGYAIIANGNLIHELAPDNREAVYDQHTLLEKMFNLYEWRDHSSSEAEYLSLESLQAADAMLDGLRPEILKENKRLWLKFDLADGINSEQELKNYTTYLQVSVQSNRYCDFNKLLKQYFENIVLLAETYQEYNKNHPPKKIIPLNLRVPHASSAFLDAFLTQFKSDDALKAIEACRSYPRDELKSFALKLEFYRKCAFGNFEEANFIENLDWWFARHDQNSTPPYFLLPLTVVNLMPGLNQIYSRKRNEFLAMRPSKNQWEKVYGELSAAKDMDSTARIIIKYGDVLQQWRRANNRENRIDISDTPALVLRAINSNLSSNLKSLPRKADETLVREAFTTLNEPLKVAVVKQVHSNEQISVQNAKEHKQRIYLLSKKKNDAIIHAFNRDTRDLTHIGDFKDIFSSRHYVECHHSALRPFYVNDDYFITGDFEHISIISRDNLHVHPIENLPASSVHALTLFNNRLYAFVGEYRKENILFSCRLDGGDRKIHLSTLRRDKQNVFERQQSFNLSGLFSDEKRGRLLFSVGGAIEGLWEFYPDSSRFNRLISTGDSFQTYANRRGDTIYFAGGGNFSHYYVFNLIDDRFDFAYFNNHAANVKRLKNKPRYAEWLNLNPPFYVNNNDLWTGGHGVNFVDLARGDGMYYVFGLSHGMGSSGGILFFPIPGSRDVYAVSGDTVYRISPPPETETEGEGE